MPLTIPQYITIKTAAGAVAAYLSPEADGLKDCIMDRELNGKSTLAFSLPIQKVRDIFALTMMGTMPKLTAPQSKWTYIDGLFRIYAPDITGHMREFVIQNPDAIEKKRDGGKLWGQVTAHESWVLLGSKLVDPGISNDPQTPSPPALAVIILSGGSDLSGGLYAVGSAGHALYALLQGTGWTVGTVDVTGIHDLETEKISKLANVQKVQEIWGGYLLWEYVFDGSGNVVERKVHLRDETLWAPYTGYQIRYRKNEKSIVRTDDTKVITKLYPFGENDLNIGSVNGGQIYIENYSYTTEELADIWINQDLSDPQEVKDQATKHLAIVCKPRHNYRAKHVDLRLKSGFQHEDYDLGHLTDLIDEELDIDDRARIIRYKFDVFQPWNPDLEVGDPIKKIQATLLESMQAAKYLDSIKTSKGQITAYKLVNESLIAEKIAKAAVDATKLNTKVVVLLGDTWTDNSPSGGSVSWTQHKLYYAGQEHVILAGNTSLKYIYWDGVANTYSASATEPDLTDGQFYIAVNNGGLHDLVWNSPAARQFIGSLFIADAAIKSAHIDYLAVLDQHVANLSANKITTGQLLAYLVEIVGKNGYFRINGDEFLVYDKSGALMGRFGHYETLAALLAAFSRASTAYDDYGNLVASGVPRYPYMALPGPVWQDLFDTDQLASEYTKYEEAAGTYTVSGGVLSVITGAGRSFLIKNDLLLQNCKLITNSDQMQDGGIVARWQDINNHYVLVINDDSGATPTQNLKLNKRVGGAYTTIASADIAWIRGTSKPIELDLYGSLLEVMFDGVKVISITDTAFTGGGVGLRSGSSVSTPNHFLDFKVYYAQQGAMSEEVCTNIVATWPTGWVVSGDAGMAAVDQGVQPGAALNTVRLTNSGTTEGYYSSPLFTLSPSTAYTLRIKARGTVGAGKFDAYVLSNTGTFVQKAVAGIAVTGAFQIFSYAFTASADITGTNQYIRFDHNGNDSGYIEIAEVEIIQKAYPLTFPGYGATMAAEVLTVPTANIFAKSAWTVKLEFTPTSEQAVTDRFAWLWEIYIDASNYYRLVIAPSGQVYIDVTSGGVTKSIADSTPLSVGQAYSFMIAGTGSVMRFCKNGAQIGSDLAYTEPVGSLPTNMYIGSDHNGANQANGVISDFAVLNQPETLADHQAEFNTGLPLAVTDATTYLMSCNGTLQPTVRGFGLWSKNGRYILQDPATGQGIELWDGATLKALIGRLSDGTIGVVISGGKLYSTEVRTGAEGATTYVGLTAGNTLVIYNNGQKVLETLANSNQGHLSFFESGAQLGKISAASSRFWVEARDGSGTPKNLNIKGADVEITGSGGNGINYYATTGGHRFYGDLAMGSGTKYNIEETENFGKRLLSVVESPEQIYTDLKKAQLDNGTRRVTIDPIWLECIEPDTEDTPWLIHLTPYADMGVYVAEIGTDYFIVKERNSGTSNSTFVWSLYATRKDHAHERLLEVL